MSKIIYVTKEALMMVFNQDYRMKLPKDTKFVLTTESDKEREQNYVADLEVKLAESEEQIWALENQKLHAHNCLNKLKQQLELKETELGNVQRMYESATRDSAIYFKENIELREQLAEKENTITTLIEDSKASKELLKKQLAEKEEQIKDLTECNQYLQIYRNKDKISFCIEKLEKVKEEFNSRKLEYKSCTTGSQCYDLRIDRINEIIDNQIKQLKEGK